ncbi:MAG: SUF system Fe-S cluster assembly regulator [Sphingomonadaceae bacterium]|nr:SUF system Fe-S cluster assembly regulator [Sphingomonadaceae bacterium]
MLRLTNLADYAVSVMAIAARQDGRASAARIAEATGLGAATAAKLLNLLAKAGLLTSARGACGGFVLARSAAEISLADVVEAVDGPIALTTCSSHGPVDCAVGATCPASHAWPQVSAGVRGALAAVTLSQIAAGPMPGRAPEIA